MTAKYVNLLSFVTFLMTVLPGCEEDKIILDSPLAFQVISVKIPPTINISSSQKIVISTEVTHPAVSDGISSVFLYFQGDKSNDITIELFDDGNVEHNSGDVIAFDMVYSRVLAENDFGFIEGNYTAFAEVKSSDGETIQSVQEHVTALLNKKPLLENIFFPDSIRAGMTPVEITASVSDSNGFADVKWVLVYGTSVQNNSTAFADTLFDRNDASSLFLKTIDSSYAAGKNGIYQLEFSAEDLSKEKSAPYSKMAYFENNPPFIREATVPDTILLPQSGTIEILITVKVTDKQSALDISEVYFDSFLPGGNPSTGNPFVMFDNGLPHDPNDSRAVGDAVAADGIYSLKIFPPAGTLSGLYTFKFYAEDKVGHLSEGPSKTIWVE